MDDKIEDMGAEDTFATPKTRARKAAVKLAKSAKSAKAAKAPKAPKALKAAAPKARRSPKAEANGHDTGTFKMEGLFGFGGFERLGEEIRERFSEGAERMRETFGSMGGNLPGLGSLRSAAGETVEVMREAAGLAGKNMREVNLQIVAYVQDDINRFFEMAKAVVQAKSLREAMEIQGEFVRTQLETQLKQIRTIGQMTVDSARDTFEPITEKVTATVERFRKAA